MFHVNDTREGRKNEISGYIKEGNQCVAVLLATADFEWTIRRAIMALCPLPTSIVKEFILRNCSGPDSYGKVWNDLIANNKGLNFPKYSQDSLRLSKLIPHWVFFKKAYDLRHKIIHGVQGTTGLSFANNQVQYILDATDIIIDFCTLNGVDLYKNLRYVKKLKSCNNCMAFKASKRFNKSKRNSGK